MYIGGCGHEMKILKKNDRWVEVGRGEKETKINRNKIATGMQCRCSNTTRPDKTRKGGKER